jgi:SNF2 family DNA or RNA helicase
LQISQKLPEQQHQVAVFLIFLSVQQNIVCVYSQKKKMLQAYIERTESGKRVGIIEGTDCIYNQPRVGIRKFQFADLQEFKETCYGLGVHYQPKRELIDLLASPVPSTIPSVFEFDPEKVLTPIARESIYPHQLQAIKSIIECHGSSAVLVAPPGTGKTLIISAVAGYLRGKILVIAPATVLAHWKKEFKKWVNLEGTIVRGAKLPGHKRPKIVIISCDSLRLNEGINSRRHWDLVILDESQKIKNPEAKRTKAILDVMNRATNVLLLSATPMMKCPSELYCQLLPVVGKRILGTYEEYTMRYSSATYQEFYPHYSHKVPVWKRKKISKLTMGTPRYKQELNCLLEHCMVRVEVNMDELLPPMTRFVEHLVFSESRMEKQRLLTAKVDKCKNENKLERDSLIMELWRLTCKQKSKYVSQWINKWLKRNPTRKLIVFGVLAKCFDYIADHLPKGVKHLRVDGKTRMNKREAYIDMLADPNNTEFRVGLMSIGTCSLGVNFAPGCFDVVFMNLSMNVFDQLQCEKKVHRLGQKNPVQCYWMVATGTFDDKLMNSLRRKLGVSTEIMEGAKQLLQFDDKLAVQLFGPPEVDSDDENDDEQKENKPKKKIKGKKIDLLKEDDYFITNQPTLFNVDGFFKWD